MIGRRDLLAALAGVATPLIAGIARAQQPSKLYRIGWLGNSSLMGPQATGYWEDWEGLRFELRLRGWITGQSIRFEPRWADGIPERFPYLARQLVADGVDLIVAPSRAAAVAAKTATATIPVVFLAVPDAVAAGLVTSLAQPGGNLTGVTSLSVELIAKQLELLKNFPGVARVGRLSGSEPMDREHMVVAASALGLQVVSVPVPLPERLTEAISASVSPSAPVDAWFVTDDLMHYANRQRLVALMAEQRKPAIYPNAAFVQAGGLMSYAANPRDHARRAAAFVDRILRGAKPGDLPVEQPSVFELVINLKTASALGLAIPPLLLARADRVIE